MATTNSDFKGSAGNLSFYKRKGDDKTIVRGKGGPSKKQIKTKASCKGIRDNNTEFGIGSHIGSLLRNTIGHWRKYSDPNMTGNMSGKFRTLIRKGAGVPGKRIVDVAAHPDVLQNFEFNNNNTWDNCVKKDIDLVVSEQRDAAMMKLSFCPAKDLAVPDGATSFRILHTLIRLPSYGFEDNKGYVPLHGAVMTSAQMSSNSFYTNLNIPVKILLPVHLSSTTSIKGTALICIVGIGFYTGTKLMEGVNAMKVVKVC